MRIKSIGYRFGCQHNGHRCILHHELKPVPWKLRIKRDIGGSGFLHGQQRHDHVQGSFEPNTHRHTRLSPERLERASQLIGSGIQLFVAQRVPAHRHRDGVRRSLDLCFKQLRETFGVWIGSLRAIPILQHLLAFEPRQGRKLRQPVLGICQDTLKQHLVLSQHPFSGLWFEEIGIEGQVGLSGEFCLDRQAQVELRSLCVDLERHPAQPLHIDFSDRSIRDVEEDLYQWSRATVARGVHRLD